MKRFCDDAFQNHCPHSYTDLAMKLGWMKDFATLSPSSQSWPVFEINFWCGTFKVLCSRQGFSFLPIPPTDSNSLCFSQGNSWSSSRTSRHITCHECLKLLDVAIPCDFFLNGDLSALFLYPPSLKKEDWSGRRLKDVSQQHLWSCCLVLSHDSHSNPH